MTTNNQDWEKGFDEINKEMLWVSDEEIDSVKSFIRSLLSHHQSSLVEEVRLLKLPNWKKLTARFGTIEPHLTYIAKRGYAIAIDDVLSLLTSYKVKE